MHVKTVLWRGITGGVALALVILIHLILTARCIACTTSGYELELEVRVRVQFIRHVTHARLILSYK